MDTTETYIKMCEKAEEIQGEAPKHLTDDGRFLYTRCGDNLYIRSGASFNDEGFSDGGRLVWLPRQDQLQEMLGSFDTCLDLLDRECNPDRSDFATLTYAYDDAKGCIGNLLTYFTSMDQLWLAFVMKENHGKVWTGEDWVKEK